MTEHIKDIERGKRIGALFVAALLLFFTVYVQPHRVHHFFEQNLDGSSEDGHSHGHAPHHDDKPAKDPDCVFQLSANRCVFGQTNQAQALNIVLSIQEFYASRGSVEYRFDSAGELHIRAPPLA